MLKKDKRDKKQKKQKKQKKERKRREGKEQSPFTDGWQATVRVGEPNGAGWLP
jgi:hypothetical protein